MLNIFSYVIYDNFLSVNDFNFSFMDANIFNASLISVVATCNLPSFILNVMLIDSFFNFDMFDWKKYIKVKKRIN
jgi:hypothetical protein